MEVKCNGSDNLYRIKSHINYNDTTKGLPKTTRACVM